VSEYRTPEEDQAQAAQEVRVRLVLEQVIPHRGTLMIEDRLAAIVLLLEDRMGREAHKVIDSVRGAS
jgi:hypothetical protein